MEIVIGILAFIFVLGIIILVHEGGHFLFARRVDILCREFAFGMGPILLKKKKGETTYSLRAFPIGGFCAIAGEELENDVLKEKESVKLVIEDKIVKKIIIDEHHPLFQDLESVRICRYDLFDLEQTGKLFIEVETKEGIMNYDVDPQAFFVFTKEEYQIAPFNRTIGSKRKRDRAMVMFGGPLMNFLLAFLVFFLAGVIGGFPDVGSNVLNVVDEGTSAYQVGLQEGDQIIRLESGTLDLTINAWTDISLFMETYSESYPSATVDVTYIRDGVTSTLSLNPQIVIYSISLVSDFTSNDVVIGKLSESSKAYKAGLREGQTIVTINGSNVTSWKDVYDVFINNIDGDEVTLGVTGVTGDITVKPYSKEIMDGQKSLSGASIPLAKMAMGISPENHFSLGESIAYSGSMTLTSFGLIFSTLDMLFTSSEVGINDLGGPIAILSLTSNVAKQGFVSLLNWTGLLSVNIGLLNLLPIPALDGGRLVFLGYEAITKKKPNQKVETALITITMFMLFGLMIYVSFNDILRWIGVR